MDCVSPLGAERGCRPTAESATLGHLEANASERQQNVNQKGTNKHKLSRFLKTKGVDIFWERKVVTGDGKAKSSTEEWKQKTVYGKMMHGQETTQQTLGE